MTIKWCDCIAEFYLLECYQLFMFKEPTSLKRIVVFEGIVARVVLFKQLSKNNNDKRNI